jgi:hypothetical protein
MAVQLLDGGLDQPHAAVIAVALDVLEQVRHVLELQPVAGLRQDADARRLVERDARAEVPHHERQRLAVIAVGRVADEGGASEGAGADHRRRGNGAS